MKKSTSGRSANMRRNPPGPLGLIHLADAETLRPERGDNLSFVGKLLAEIPRQKQPKDGGRGMSTKARGDDDSCIQGSGGHRAGVAGSVGSAWPVYAAGPKPDGRSDPSFHIEHFMGEQAHVVCIGAGCCAFDPARVVEFWGERFKLPGSVIAGGGAYRRNRNPRLTRTICIPLSLHAEFGHDCYRIMVYRHRWYKLACELLCT